MAYEQWTEASWHRGLLLQAYINASRGDHAAGELPSSRNAVVSASEALLPVTQHPGGHIFVHDIPMQQHVGVKRRMPSSAEQGLLALDAQAPWTAQTAVIPRKQPRVSMKQDSVCYLDADQHHVGMPGQLVGAALMRDPRELRESMQPCLSRTSLHPHHAVEYAAVADAEPLRSHLSEQLSISDQLSGYVSEQLGLGSQQQQQQYYYAEDRCSPCSTIIHGLSAGSLHGSASTVPSSAASILSNSAALASSLDAQLLLYEFDCPQASEQLLQFSSHQHHQQQQHLQAPDTILLPMDHRPLHWSAQPANMDVIMVGPMQVQQVQMPSSSTPCYYNPPPARLPRQQQHHQQHHQHHQQHHQHHQQAQQAQQYQQYRQQEYVVQQAQQQQQQQQQQLRQQQALQQQQLLQQQQAQQYQMAPRQRSAAAVHVPTAYTSSQPGCSCHLQDRRQPPPPSAILPMAPGSTILQPMQPLYPATSTLPLHFLPAAATYELLPASYACGRPGCSCGGAIAAPPPPPPAAPALSYAGYSRAHSPPSSSNADFFLYEPRTPRLQPAHFIKSLSSLLKARSCTTPGLAEHLYGRLQALCMQHGSSGGCSASAAAVAVLSQQEDHVMAALVWMCAKLEENRRSIMPTKAYAAALAMPAQRLAVIELVVMHALDWSPYRGWLP